MVPIYKSNWSVYAVGVLYLSTGNKTQHNPFLVSEKNSSSNVVPTVKKQVRGNLMFSHQMKALDR